MFVVHIYTDLRYRVTPKKAKLKKKCSDDVAISADAGVFVHRPDKGETYRPGLQRRPTTLTPVPAMPPDTSIRLG